MQVSIAYDRGELELSIEPERLVTSWEGPPGLPEAALGDAIRRGLDEPLGFPPLARAVVPGDHVVLAVDADLPEPATILAPLVNRLEAAGVERDAILVLIADGVAGPDFEVPAGVRTARHDPTDREKLAYLAATQEGRRIYLDREAVEADMLIPVGRVSADARFGTRGPWATLFPGLGEVDARLALSATKGSLAESAEVGWLLGNLFQVAVVPGTSGVAAVLAGASESVLEASQERMAALWTLRVDRRPEIVVVGVGAEAGVEATWRAFATGASLVGRGGKVIALSGAEGPIGPAASRLAGADRPGPSDLRGAEREPDYAAAMGLAQALAWADLYLLSGLDPDSVEDLGIVPLSRPAEARRLAEGGRDVALIANAEMTLIELVEDPS